MGIFQNLSNALGVRKEMSVEDFMSAAEAEEVDVMHQQADFYVKPIALQTDADLKVVEEELTNKNLVLLNITPIARNPNKLKAAVEHLRNMIRDCLVKGLSALETKEHAVKVLLRSATQNTQPQETCPA